MSIELPEAQILAEQIVINSCESKSSHFAYKTIRSLCGTSIEKLSLGGMSGVLLPKVPNLAHATIVPAQLHKHYAPPR